VVEVKNAFTSKERRDQRRDGESVYAVDPRESN
jgi:hypothetical protein